MRPAAGEPRARRAGRARAGGATRDASHWSRSGRAYHADDDADGTIDRIVIRGADGVPTAVWVDENRDGITERLSRVDGASDAVEELRDTDGDGVPDRRLTFGAGVEPIAGAGDEVTVTIQHTGSMPKTSMGHSFVLLAQGVEMADFGAAASRRRTATTSRPIGRPT